MKFAAGYEEESQNPIQDSVYRLPSAFHTKEGDFMSVLDGTGSGRRRGSLALVGLLGCAALTAGCGAGNATSGGEAGALSIALADEPSTLDPQAQLDGNERAVTDNIYETLLRRDPDTNELTPHLAVELPAQVDPTTWEFVLREGVTFTDGEAFDATTAAFSINRVIDPEFNSAQGDFYEGITGAEAVDATTLRVMTAEPDPLLPARMYGLKMMAPDAAAESDVTSQPVGTGPYKLTKYTRGQEIDLVRNDDYWGDKPSIEKVSIRFLPEAGSRASALKTGEVDLATVIPAEQTGGLPQVLSREGLEFPVFRLKTTSGPLADPRIGQALNYAVDKEALAENLYGGYAKVAQCQPLSKAQFGFNPDLEAYPYDPDKAKALLKEAGYDGETVTFLGPTGRWLKDSELNEAVVGYLEEAGLKIDSQIMPFSAYLDTFTIANPKENPKSPDIGMVSASNELYDASKISTYYATDGALSTYSNPEVDAALQAASKSADEATRLQAFREATRVGCEDDPALIFTVNLEDIYGASKRLDWEPRFDGSLYIPEMQLS
jgi:peptide/nickel transport system substrate-binding protein